MLGRFYEYNLMGIYANIKSTLVLFTDRYKTELLKSVIFFGGVLIMTGYTHSNGEVIWSC